MAEVFWPGPYPYEIARHSSLQLCYCCSYPSNHINRLRVTGNWKTWVWLADPDILRKQHLDRQRAKCHADVAEHERLIGHDYRGGRRHIAHGDEQFAGVGQRLGFAHTNDGLQRCGEWNLGVEYSAADDYRQRRAAGPAAGHILCRQPGLGECGSNHNHYVGHHERDLRHYQSARGAH
jgi:hypothetical protein